MILLGHLLLGLNGSPGSSNCQVRDCQEYTLWPGKPSMWGMFAASGGNFVKPVLVKVTAWPTRRYTDWTTTAGGSG